MRNRKKTIEKQHRSVEWISCSTNDTEIVNEKINIINDEAIDVYNIGLESES